MEVNTNQAAELQLQMDRISRKIDFLFDRLGIAYSDGDVPVYVLQARELVRLGRDSDAIRVIREHTAVGMLEARSIVEDLAKRLGRTQINLESVVPPQGLSGATTGVGVSADPLNQAAVEEAWRRAVRESEAQRL